MQGVCCPGDVHWARLEASALGSLIAAYPALKRRERRDDDDVDTGDVVVEVTRSSGEVPGNAQVEVQRRCRGGGIRCDVPRQDSEHHGGSVVSAGRPGARWQPCWSHSPRRCRRRTQLADGVGYDQLAHRTIVRSTRLRGIGTCLHDHPLRLYKIFNKIHIILPNIPSICCHIQF